MITNFQHITRRTLVTLTHQNSVIPSKAHESDSGFDLTIVERKDYKYDTSNDNNSMHQTVIDKPFKVQMFRTGVHIQPPEGYYFEMVPRSSLQKMGYILANCVGVIDNEYRGEIMVPLYKFDADKPDIELPARVVQLIPRKIEPMVFEQSLFLDTDTARGENGFGSSAGYLVK